MTRSDMNIVPVYDHEISDLLDAGRTLETLHKLSGRDEHLVQARYVQTILRRAQAHLAPDSLAVQDEVST